MTEARRRAPDLVRPTWIMAHQQVSGRGRRGRSWRMAAGNLAATLVMRPDCAASEAALRSFSAALALCQSLSGFADRDALALKWPNDVLLNNGKVAGILLESEGQGERINWLAIGVGVNLAEAPLAGDVEDRAVRPVSLLGETGKVAAPEAFLTLLAGHFAVLEQQFDAQGFEPIRRLWLSQAARLGEPITARTPRDEITGVFETIDAAGQLVLRTSSGQVAVPAADVFF